jgi:hypothetical protein
LKSRYLRGIKFLASERDKFLERVLFTHKTQSIAFSLVVDDFGVKYERKEDMDHLVKTLGDRYPIKVDLKAELYLGITIK